MTALVLLGCCALACLTVYLISRERLALERHRIASDARTAEHADAVASRLDALEAAAKVRADDVAALRDAMRSLHERNDAQVRNLGAEVKQLLADHETKLSGIVATAAHGARGRFIGGRQS